MTAAPATALRKAGALLRRLQGRRAQSARVQGNVVWLPGNPPYFDPALWSARATTVPVFAAGACLPAMSGVRPSLESNRHPRPLGLPCRVVFPNPPPRLHATLQDVHFVNGMQGPRKGPSRWKTLEWGGGGPLAARQPEGAGSRRSPQPRSWRAAGGWRAAPPSAARCILNPLPRAVLLGVSRTRPARLLPSGSPLSLLPAAGWPRSPVPTADGAPSRFAWVALGARPRCLRSGARASV